MFKYLKEYRMDQMREIIANSKRDPLESTQRLDGKLCVITGATSGVGLATARRLHAFGADILMVNRNEEKSRALVANLNEGTAEGQQEKEIPAKTGKVDFITADFSDLHQTVEAGKQILNYGQPVDILINNAGIHMTTRKLTNDGLEMVFAVNHMSPYILTRMVLPQMQERASGRIIQVNSQGHRFFGLNLKDLDWKRRPYIGLRAYGAAKTAQLLCTWEFDDVIDGSAPTINAMHPGEVRTNVGNNNGPLYRWFQRKFVTSGLKDVERSAIALHYLAADPAMEGISGQFFNLNHPETPAPHALDSELGRRIWAVSNELADKFIGSR